MADLARHAGVVHEIDRAVLPEGYHLANLEVLSWGGRVRCWFCRSHTARHFGHTCPYAEANLKYLALVRKEGDLYSTTVDGAAGVERLLHSV